MKRRLAAMISGIWLFTGCGALVGGECAEGYVVSAGECIRGVDLAGATASGTSTGGATASGSGVGGSDSGTGGASGSTSPTSGGGGHIVTTSTSGSDSTASSSSSSSPSGVGGSGAGGGFSCDPPLVDCDGTCVDVTSDPSNCGHCGVECPTEICVMGQCVGSLAGHSVIVGMDYENATLGAPPSVLLGNAVFLAAHEPLHLLQYKEFAAPALIANVTGVIANEAGKRQRTVLTTTASTAAAVPALLAMGGIDVFLVHHESGAAPGTLGPIGASWATALSTFTKKGGVVVVLASIKGTTEMSDLLTQSLLLANGGAMVRTGEDLFNPGMLDAVGAGVLSPFLGKKNSVSFAALEVASPSLSYVVTSSDGAPIVLHRVVLGP